MAEFWAEYGALAYLVAAGWAFFEGETFVLFAAAAGKHTGVVDPWILMFAVWAGSYCGDQTWFFLGRRYGARALKRIPGAEKRVAVATSFLERYGALFVLTFRFAYGIRNVASAACGIAGMDHRRFAFLNFFAAGIWAASFVWVGWFVAGLFTPPQLVYGIGGIGLAVFLFFVIRFVLARRRAARLAREQAAEARAATIAAAEHAPEKAEV